MYSDFINKVTVLILTYNESANIVRSLSALSRFQEVVVLDSGSSDKTAELAASFRNVRLLTRLFDDHATQWNFGLYETGITRPWVLALDADYLVPEQLVDEVAGLIPDVSTSGYKVSFRYCINGRPLSAALYPEHVVLFRRDRGRYVQHGHTQRLLVEGQIETLSAKIDHDDRKPLARWLQSQQRYANLEAGYLLSLPREKLRFVDRIRLTGILGPPMVFFYTLIVKRCIFDGAPGWFYVLQRTLAELIIAIEIVDRRLKITRT